MTQFVRELVHSRKQMLKTTLRVLGAAMLGAAAVWASPYSVMFNSTASLPRGLYLAQETSPSALKKGDIACFAYQEPGWAQGRAYFAPGRKLCKYLVGMAGDVVYRDGPALWVGDRQGEPLARLTERDSQGRVMPQDALLPGPIPVGTAVLLTPQYPNSLDSRYLGPVALEQISHRLVYPIWTWR